MKVLLILLALSGCEALGGDCKPHPAFVEVTGSPEKDWVTGLMLTRFVGKGADGKFYTRLGTNGCWAAVQ